MLDFSDQTFADFFASEFKVNINDQKFCANGGSKGKRLRYYLQTCDDETAVRVLAALWEHRCEYIARSGAKDPVVDAQSRLEHLINRLSGGTPPKPAYSIATPIVDHKKVLAIKSELLQVSSLSAHARGFAFEKFLRGLFDAFGLAAQEPFRLKGEQIDGSFQLGGDTYLLEAKWHGQPIGVADLHVFHGKIEQKAAWTRGLFVSNSGFSEDGLAAFGRGKRVVCMDGLDLYEMLDREIPLSKVLDRKVRRAAETGMPFLRVRDLFPN
ncbi:hypothetical protein BG58_30740 [Caballeronia jiangsuensis]|nr:hypothetical protein BG58_30740 [Caballeronia jiangsuensis]